MGLFDHLFKPKPEPAGEEIVEGETVAPEALAAVESASQNTGPSRPDPSTFLHPKNFIPRAGSPIVPAPKSPLAPAARFGERLVFSLDTRDRRVLTQGWRRASSEDPVSMAETLRDAGARRFIHTDTARDGTLGGVDRSGFSALLPLGLPVLVAGGVASYADLEAIRDAGAEGAIVGRALLQGKIELGPALAL